ncbi:MAG TPA: hypothetical protein VIP82_20720 [Microbacterium sp.]
MSGPHHAGPRRRTTWWRGPWPPTILILAGTGVLVWELSWAIPLLNGG